MKRIIYAIFFSYIMIFSQSGTLFSKAMDNLAPKTPPVLPVEDFNSEYDWLELGGAYSKQTIEINSESNLVFKYMGIMANGVSGFPGNSNGGWSFYGGVFYLSGAMDMNMMNTPLSLDLNGIVIPMGLDFAFRPMGTPEGSNLMLFSGISGSYILMTSSVDFKTTENYGGYTQTTKYSMLMMASGFNYGFMGGAKATLAVNENFKLVPYIFIQRTAFKLSTDITTEMTSTSDAPGTYAVYNSDTQSQSINAPAVTSVIWGFDIIFGRVSIGTMLDIFKSSNKSFSLSATYRFQMERSYGEAGQTKMQ